MPETTLVVQGSSGLGQTGELGVRMAVLLEITLVVQARYSWDRRNTTREGYRGTCLIGRLCQRELVLP